MDQKESQFKKPFLNIGGADGPPPMVPPAPALDNLPTAHLPQAPRAAQSRPPVDALPTTHLPQTPPPHAPQRPPTKPRRPRSRRRRIGLVLLLVALLLLGGTGAYAYYYVQTNIQAPLASFTHPVSRSTDEPASQNDQNTGDVTGHVWNILLLGSDNDKKYTFPAVLTQVMMVVHIDTIHNQVYMVSIPRDSWVYVPEVGGLHKIDQAFFLGARQRASFDDGVRLARLTIEKDYGITIDRYAWVGLDGFAKVIDTLGGIDIDVTHPIVDDTYPDDTGNNANNPNAYRRLYLAPGPQHLNGEQALEYVRSRHSDLVGDIGRTQRQQQVLDALKIKLNASNVVSHISQLIADMKGKVYYDFNEQELLSFANYGRSLPSNALHRLTLGPGAGDQNFGTLQTVYDPTIQQNQDVLIPNCDTIQPVINRIFGLGNAQSCNVTGP